MKFDNNIINSLGNFPGGSIEHKKANIFCILGIDAQCQVGEPITCTETAFLGHAAKALDGARDFKANAFMNFVTEFSLKIRSTFSRRAPKDTWTHLHNSHHTTRQIEYIWDGLPDRAALDTDVLEDCASITPTDHRPNFARYLGDLSIYTKRDRRDISNTCLVGSVRTRNSTTAKSWDIWELWIATFSNILRRRSMRLTGITFLRMALLCRISITQIRTRALEDGLLYFLIQM